MMLPAAVSTVLCARGAAAANGAVVSQALRSLTSSSAAAAGEAASPPAAQDVRAAYEHCVHLVREHDPENFIWVTQLPKGLRGKVLALRAYNLETMLIGEAVKSKEAIVTQIRFQWWRDALSALSDKAPPAKHPILIALWDTLYNSSSSSSSSGAKGGGGGSRASIYQLKRMLDAREQDLLSPQPPLSVKDLEAYAESTASQLLYLQLAAAGVASRESDHAASHLGKAIGIALLLRGTAFQASRRRAYLPLDLCAQAGVSQEDVYRGVVSEGLRDAVLGVATAAMGHLREAQRLVGGLPPAAPQVLQQGTLAGLYLRGLERAGFNVFDAELAASGGASPLRRLLALKWNLLRGSVGA